MTLAEPPARIASAPSLHQRILGEIEDKILSGAWPPGMRLPFEHELTTQYGCSRMTVNKVMTQLANAGLINRRRRAGSFVTRPHTQSAVLQIEDLGSEVEALGLPYRFAILERSRRRSTREDRERLAVPALDPILQVECRHFAGHQPFCLEQRLISLAAVPEAEAEAFAAVSPGTWLVRKVPWTSAEHTIRAIGAGETEATGLGIEAGTPCLVIERRTWRAEMPVTFVRLTYPGDAHEVVARFTPRQA